MAIILVDFDGTCIPTLPVGSRLDDFNTGAEEVLKKLIEAGHKIVLWTVRNESSQNPYNIIAKQFIGKSSLCEAIDWFKKRDIQLYGVNEVPDEISKVGVGRKVLGDFLIDDTAIGAPIKEVTIEYFSYLTDSYSTLETYHIDWEIIEQLLIKQGLL